MIKSPKHLLSKADSKTQSKHYNSKLIEEDDINTEKQEETDIDSVIDEVL